MEAGIIIALITSGVSLIIALLSRRKTNADADKSDADAADVIQRAAAQLVTPLTRRIETLEDSQVRLERKLTRAMNRITYLMGGISVLVRQISDAGHTPQWRPDDWQVDCEDKDRQ